MEPLQFQPFQGNVDASFWQELARRKLHVYKLDESPKEIGGIYRPSSRVATPARISLRRESFSLTASPAADATLPVNDIIIPGTLINKNTAEAFKDVDKQALINEAAKKVLADILSGAAIADPALLSPFLLLTFADLKSQKYVYWFAHPVLAPKALYNLAGAPAQLSPDATAQLIQTLRRLGETSGGRIPPFFCVDPVTYAASPLSPSGSLFGFVDPCPLENNPGWPLRNLLAYLALLVRTPRARVVALRALSVDAILSEVPSLVFDIDFSEVLASIASVDGINIGTTFTATGWSLNSNGKPGPDIASLRAIMDPGTIAENAVNLNVNLMRWRVLPELNVEMLASTKVLLIGAGTLGCNVARAFLGWGVRHISFVDNGKVSYSNPVRQSLFELTDCADGGAFKAEAAARSLARIFPGVSSSGHVLSIPMPGHPVSSAEEGAIAADVQSLSALIAAHDVIFLLTDTRESRWLPTVLCRSMKKLVLNVALGFDSYLIIRHGDERIASPEPQLGCYFCNDVVAPGNSTKDRTLDQQCTVTRPGVAMIASAMAVELCVGLLHHPLRGQAPAAEDSGSPASSSFGILPHTIRGFLSTYSHMLAHSRSFDSCAACGEAVTALYNTRGFSFLLDVFNDPKYLERAAGLDKYYAAADAAFTEWDDDDAGDAEADVVEEDE